MRANRAYALACARFNILSSVFLPWLYAAAAAAALAAVLRTFSRFCGARPCAIAICAMCVCDAME